MAYSCDLRKEEHIVITSHYLPVPLLMSEILVLTREKKNRALTATMMSFNNPFTDNCVKSSMVIMLQKFAKEEEKVLGQMSIKKPR
ncbi:hypothetical protein CHS0354_002705 [Potamilus streckersoni]|uniref:Uncharacterized protein n=1 Tax=Potamilus streckersoni TaxID=2493646 RepID=A0AAE0VL13_9BIVA|nr:hypothetical protein CHS0354_002705 [Potamilus streckersoni]